MFCLEQAFQAAEQYVILEKVSRVVKVKSTPY